MNSYFSWFTKTSPSNESTYFSCRETLLRSYRYHFDSRSNLDQKYYFDHVFYKEIYTNIVNRYLPLTKLIWKDPSIECKLVVVKDLDIPAARYWANKSTMENQTVAYKDQILLEVNKPVNFYDVSWILFTSWYGVNSLSPILKKYLRIKRFSNVFPDLYCNELLELPEQNGPHNLMLRVFHRYYYGYGILRDKIKEDLRNNEGRVVIPAKIMKELI